MKEKAKKFIETLNDPKKKIIIKLVLYGVFFLVIYSLVFISNSSNDYEIAEETPVMNYSKMKNEIMEKDIINVKYNIENILIEGIIQNNILNGTVEFDDGTVNKITYYDDNLYQVIKDEEILNNDLLSNINLKYLLPKNIIKTINEYEGLNSSDEKSYNYNIDNVNYTVYLTDERIEKIIILDNLITYNLTFN